MGIRRATPAARLSDEPPEPMHVLSRLTRNLPITRKLTLIMVLASTIAVLLASTLFGLAEVVSKRSDVAENLATLGGVVATNSAAAILLEDENQASEALMSLSAYPDIVRGQVITRDGHVFAGYRRDGEMPESRIGEELVHDMVRNVATTGESQRRFFGMHHLEAVYPIHLDGELIGFLYLQSSLNELAATVNRIVMLALGTVLIAIVVAIAVSMPMQSLISHPVVSLSALMKRVTREQDYSLRAAPASSDEIGDLMHGFNAMLEQISTRDEQLADANVRLKRAVKGTLEARDAALSASRAKSEFLARMSHEIRTPMNGVLGMTDLLLAGNLGQTERKFAETIQQSGETLLAVINDILDFSKIEAGKLELDHSEFDMAEVVESVVGLLFGTAHGQGVELIADISPTTQTRVKGDQVRLRQVLMNLVGNAIKFTREGEIVLRLLTYADPAGVKGFRVEVEDTGIGIEPEKEKAIFGRFAQADVSTTREYGGTGLGLAISRQLVELMGGKIGVDSAPGHGSTFWFTVMLPLAEQQEPGTRCEFDSLEGIRALVVDDNDTNREILERQLDAWAVDVVSATGAAEAIELLQDDESGLFDIVLLDYFMPDTDALELAWAIRSRPDFGDPALLMLSSAGPDFDRKIIEEAGIDLYVAKPVRRDDLYAAVVRVLEDHEGATVASPTPGAVNPVPEAKVDLHVLLVEDTPVNLQVAEHMLASIGCDIAAVRNGQEALDALEQQAFDLVLMDCQMPVMDGFTATCKQREREAGTDARVPIIALTANALDEDRQRCVAAGMDDFISKPFTRKALVETIARWAPADNAIADQVRSSAIEVATLEQIAALDPENGNALVGEIIETYLQDSKPLFDQLTRTATNSDAEEAARVAHALKSSSANVGANTLSGLCRSIEMDAREGRVDNLCDSVSRAAAEYEVVVSELRAAARSLAA